MAYIHDTPGSDGTNGTPLACTSAVVIATGDELLTGRRVDTNSAWIAARLESLGVPVREHRLLGDDLDAIVAAFRDVIGPGTLVISTGGLGPTRDDLGRLALARATDDELVVDNCSLAAIQAWYASRSRAMPETNAVQAERPSRAVSLTNPNGTAPGVMLRIDGGGAVFLLPGPPPEMKPMFERCVAAAVQATRPRPVEWMLVSAGLGESTIAQRVAGLMDRGREPSVGTTASHGIVRVLVRSHQGDAPAVESVSSQIRALIGEHVLAEGSPEEIDSDGFAGYLLGQLRARGLTLATAESCTGGMIGADLTAVAGSSDVYVGGVVSYANRVKVERLGVEPVIIEQHGAVSNQVAEAMARGCRGILHASVAVSVTGVAGPDGGSDEKPVGTVCIGVAFAGEDGAECVDVRRHQFFGSREQIRRWTVNTALATVLGTLSGGAPPFMTEAVVQA